MSLFNQVHGTTEPTLESGQCSTHQGPTLETGQSCPLQGPSESQPSRIQSVNPFLVVENGGTAACSNKKRGRGKYKSNTIDIKTTCGTKITVNIPDDTDRAVGYGARDIVNYCGLIMRSTISFRDGDWQEIVLKYGKTMLFKVKDKFEVSSGMREDVLQAFVISTMQRLFRMWKTRLSTHYSRYNTNAERLSHQPEDVEFEDWKYLVNYFGSENFKAVSERNRKNRKNRMTSHTCGTRSFAEVEESTRNAETGEKDTPDRVWEIQHAYKNDKEEVVWADLLSQQVHEVVAQQQSLEIEHPVTQDETLGSILGERIGYVCGKGYKKKPPKKSRMQQTNLEASVFSTVEIVSQEMQSKMDQKLQEECEQMSAELKRNMQDELQRKFEEERGYVNQEIDKRFQLEVDKKIQEYFATFMSRVQQGQCI